jgi:hypothetical protein
MWEAQGGAWASQAGAAFSNPLTSELADGFSKTPLHALREWPCYGAGAAEVGWRSTDSSWLKINIDIYKGTHTYG